MRIGKRIVSFSVAFLLLLSLLPASPAFAAKIQDHVYLNDMDGARTATIALQDAVSRQDSVAVLSMAPNEMVDLKFYGIPDYRTVGMGWVTSDPSVLMIDSMGRIFAIKEGRAFVTYIAKGYDTIPVEILVGPETLNDFLTQHTSRTDDAGVSETVVPSAGQVSIAPVSGAVGQDPNRETEQYIAPETPAAGIVYQNDVTVQKRKDEAVILYIGERVDLKMTDESGAELSQGRWVSTNPLIASVDREGVVTALRHGSASIEYRVQNIALAYIRIDSVDVNAPFENVPTSEGTGLVPDTNDLPSESENYSTVGGATASGISTQRVKTLRFRMRGSNTPCLTDEELASALAASEASFNGTIYIADQETKEAYEHYEFSSVNESKDFCFMGAKNYSTSAYSVTWFSSDTNVATVDEKGVVTAVGGGSAVISVMVTDRATGQIAYDSAPLDVTVAVAHCDFIYESYRLCSITLPPLEDTKYINVDFSPKVPIANSSPSWDGDLFSLYLDRDLEDGQHYTFSVYSHGKLVGLGGFTFHKPLLQVKVGGEFTTFASADPIEEVMFGEHEPLERYIRIKYNLPDDASNVAPRFIPSYAFMSGYDIEEWDHDTYPFFLKIENPEVVDIETGSGLLDIRGKGNSLVTVLYDQNGKIVPLGNFEIPVGAKRTLSKISDVPAQGGYNASNAKLCLLSRDTIPGFNQGKFVVNCVDQYGDPFIPDDIEVEVKYKREDASYMFSAIETDINSVSFIPNAGYFEEHADISHRLVDVKITCLAEGRRASTICSVRIDNSEYLHGLDNFKESYQVLWEYDNDNIGLLGNEGSYGKYVNVRLAHCINGIPFELYPIDGPYSTISELTGNDALSPYEGQCFVKITVKARQGRDNLEYNGYAYDANSNDPIEIGCYSYNDEHDEISILCRPPVALLDDAYSEPQGNTTVYATFYTVTCEEVDDIVVFSQQRLTSKSQTFHNRDKIRAEWTYYNATGSEFYGDPVNWLEQNGEFVIVAGDHRFVVNKEHSFAKNGIDVQIETGTDDPYYIRKVQLYIPVGEGYLKTSLFIKQRMISEDTQ